MLGVRTPARLRPSGAGTLAAHNQQRVVLVDIEQPTVRCHPGIEQTRRFKAASMFARSASGWPEENHTTPTAARRAGCARPDHRVYAAQAAADESRSAGGAIPRSTPVPGRCCFEARAASARCAAMRCDAWYLGLPDRPGERTFSLWRLTPIVEGVFEFVGITGRVSMTPPAQHGMRRRARPVRSRDAARARRSPSNALVEIGLGGGKGFLGDGELLARGIDLAVELPRYAARRRAAVSPASRSAVATPSTRLCIDVGQDAVFRLPLDASSPAQRAARLPGHLPQACPSCPCLVRFVRSLLLLPLFPPEPFRGLHRFLPPSRHRLSHSSAASRASSKVPRVLHLRAVPQGFLLGRACCSSISNWAILLLQFRQLALRCSSAASAARNWRMVVS
jgi:hypothetical protein